MYWFDELFSCYRAMITNYLRLKVFMFDDPAILVQKCYLLRLEKEVVDGIQVDVSSSRASR